MIIGDLAAWEQEKEALHPVFQRAVDFIRSRDLRQHELGRFDIDGDNLFALVQEVETVPPAERKSEHHRTYIDLQYLVDCPEDELLIVARQSPRNRPVEDALEEKDYALYDEVEGEFEIRLRPGMFAVFFPSDLHRPACTASGGVRLRKVVFKINKNLLEA